MPRWRYLRILDTERSEVSNFLRYRHRGHLTDLDLPQLCLIALVCITAVIGTLN